MVVDTSAIVAILCNEPEKDRFVDLILRADACVMSAVSIQEAGMVVAGRQGDGDGDAYTLAKSGELSLLFKGDDFTKTDIAVADPRE